MINELVDEYATANYDEDWEENLGHAHCPIRNKHYQQVSQLRELTLIDSPSVKPDMKFNVRSYGNQSKSDKLLSGSSDDN
jgi:hypothetical protein